MLKQMDYILITVKPRLMHKIMGFLINRPEVALQLTNSIGPIQNIFFYSCTVNAEKLI